MSWNEDTVSWIQLGLALAGLGLLGYGRWLTARGRPDAHRKLRDRALAALGLLGALAYVNFGSLHFTNFIHAWDTFHYYVGAKYFPELGYERLYECTALADHESGFQEAVARRKLTDLRTNELVPATGILAAPERCKAHFTAERWEAFKADISFFRRRVHASKWEMIQHDHGYNATPVWHLLGHLLASLAPASEVQVTALNLLDPLLLLAMAGLIAWAFGWRVAAVAALVFGTSFPNRFYWTGGAFLRHDWLFYLVAGVCLLKKGRPLLAGLAFAYATSLRIFPGFVLVGPLLAAIEHFRRERRVDPRYARFLGGAAVGLVLLVGTSYVLTGGADTFRRFYVNTAKHAATPLTNHMGLRTVVSYRPDRVGPRLWNGKAVDPWGAWKAGRLQSFREARWVFAAGVVAFLALLYFALRGALEPRSGEPPLEPWMAAALSAPLIAVGTELTCYYYAFVVAIALLHERRCEVGLLLLGYCAITQFIARAPLPWMSRWLDEQYTAMSVAALAAFGAVMWLFTHDGARYCLAPASVTPSAGKTRQQRRKAR